MDIKDLIFICIILSITTLFNSRIYWLIKHKQDDPLKAVIPWFEKLREDDEVNKAFMDKG